jgi:hypothetical protein
MESEGKVKLVADEHPIWDEKQIVHDNDRQDGCTQALSATFAGVELKLIFEISSKYQALVPRSDEVFDFHQRWLSV